ncbi:formate transporter 1 [Escherichia coli]|nr:formate transporter 1 [Escherichia coli]
MKADNPFDLLLPAAMAKVAEEAGVYKATKHPLKTFYLAITAGVFISIAFVFYITATTGTGHNALRHGKNWLAAFASLWG